MEYLKDSFSLGYGSDRYRDGWERTFSNAEECPRCHAILVYVGTVNGHEYYICESCGEGRYMYTEED